MRVRFWLGVALIVGGCNRGAPAASPEATPAAMPVPGEPAAADPAPARPLVDPEAHAAAHRAIQERQLRKPLEPSPLVRDVALENPEALAPFHEALAALSAGERHRVRVLAYGSSNTAGDRYTGYLRGYLQHRYGDGGPGFVALVPLWKWHRHQEVSVKATGWDVVHDLKPGTGADGRYGLMGVRGQSRRAGARIELTLRDEGATAEHGSIWYDPRPGGGTLEVRVDGGEPTTLDTGSGSGTAELLTPGHALTITHSGGGEVRLFGAVLETDAPGVVVDELGIGGSGARRLLRWDAPLWTEHVQRRNPALFILAYGGIESMRDTHDPARWKRELGRVTGILQSAAPDAACLLLGPQDRQHKNDRGVRERPATLDAIIDGVRQVAAERGCAFFDTQAMMGGPGSMPRWVEAGLARRDHVHFTPTGYAHMGRVLVDAMLAE